LPGFPATVYRESIGEALSGMTTGVKIEGIHSTKDGRVFFRFFTGGIPEREEGLTILTVNSCSGGLPRPQRGWAGARGAIILKKGFLPERQTR